MNHWIQPSIDSRTGASHRRRGVVCQDACGSVVFRDAAGSPIQVLVVSDGHGGARYVRSDVGARLACDVAMRELRQALTPARVEDPGALEQWRAWLAAELPERIVQAWRRAVEAHWHADPATDGSPFSPLPYGATLGVLLLTRAWWAHTGLGDWDLVRIEAGGGEALLSEEPEREAGGEATFSLCLERAERHFVPRTALHPLTPETPPFSLLLCSDGLRKSCGSDADFLTLSRYLVGLAPTGDPSGSGELAGALDHISGQGSGDDISVAVARWATQDPPWPEPGLSLPARLVQPAPGVRSGSLSDHPDAAASERALTASEPVSGWGVVPPAAGSPTAAVSSDQVQMPGESGRDGPSRLLLLAVALLGLGAVLLAAHVGLGPFASGRAPQAPALTAQQRSDLRRQVAALCNPAPGVPPPQRRQGMGDSGPVSSPGAGAPRTGIAETAGGPALAAPGPPAAAGADRSFTPRPSSVAPGSRTSGANAVHPSSDPQRRQRLAATLAARASVFQRLASGDPAAVGALLRQSHADPLSALIAYSAADASLRPPPVPATRPGWLPRLAGGAPAPLSPLTELGVCPDLHQALRAAWQHHGSLGAAPASSDASPPASPAVPQTSSLQRGEPSR